MEKSRRQFVTASLAGLPMLAYAGSTAAPAFASQAAGAVRGRPALVDPVLEQTIATVRELAAEAQAKPSLRRENARAIEATLGIQATHVALHYDAQVQRGLRRRQARVGRAVFLDELVKSVREHGHQNVTHELIDSALTQLEKGGFSQSLRELQRSIRAARLNGRDAIQAASFAPAQYDFCSDVKRAIELAEIAAGIICALAVLEPTLALEPFCAAAGFVVATYKLMEWIWCSGW